MKIRTPQISNSLKHSSRGCRPGARLLIPLVFVCLALLPRAQAVLPAPDGGYPGGNTAEGTNALLSRTSGAYNTAVGLNALLKDTTGSRNTANGVNALRFNTTGMSNTAIGTNTLFVNSASNNTAIGDSALFVNTTGGQNTATGYHALFSNTTGKENTANGYGALFSNTTISGLAGDFNTANGAFALFSNTTGGANTATGDGALFSNTTGGSNTANGISALYNNIIGDFNTANGENALVFNSTGDNNTASGHNALRNNTMGSGNIALGNNAGTNLTTGDNNIDIGNGGVAAEAATIRIGTVGTQTATFIAGISGVIVPGGVPVIIDANGHLGTIVSSARFKDEIKPMDKASEAILGLKPVTFCYKKELDPNGMPQFGLVAEEVEKVNPDLVARDAEGEVYTVRYDAVNAMLLNEFLKEHRKVQEQEATIAELKSTTAKQEATAAQQQKEIATLTAGLQKVSDQLELSKPAPRTVLNDQ
jgi:trimeric autotransporter adhesin